MSILADVRRRLGLALGLALASCHADRAVTLPAPDLPAWAKSLLVIVEDEDLRVGTAVESGFDGPLRLALPRGASARAAALAVTVLAYPFPLSRLGLLAGELSFPDDRAPASTRPVPEAGATYLADLADHSWSSASATPDRLRALSIALAPLEGPLEAPVAVSAGADFTCAAQRSGSVLCFGVNDQAQLGAEGPIASSTPTLTRAQFATALASGGAHTCSVQRDGEVWCWGHGDDGQLGRTTVGEGSNPAPAEGVVDAVAISAGSAHSCALRASGRVSCWGANDRGQSGRAISPATSHLAPGEVTGLPGPAIEIGSGNAHNCVLIADGTVWCFGADAHGQLGDGGGADAGVPHAIPGVTGVDALGVGTAFACASSSGVVRCWGAIDAPGGPSPTQVALGPEGRLEVTGQQACRIAADGRGADCLGENGFGSQAADPLRHPELWEALGGIDRLSCDVISIHCCAIGRAGGLWCWGANGSGQVGRPFPLPRNAPVALAGLMPVRSMALGADVSCAIEESGRAPCVGRNAGGVIASSTIAIALRPVEIALPSPPAELALGDQHACARTSTAEPIYCWGDDAFAQIDGTLPPRSGYPATPVPGTLGAHGVVAAADHSCAITADGGGVLCWGSNDEGELGDGALDHPTAPTRVIGLPGAIAQVAAGRQFNCALTAGGDVYCWGYNKDGQLGAGTRLLSSPTAVQVPDLSGVVELGAGFHHACARLSSGAVLCWGRNLKGELGDGTTEDRAPTAPFQGIDDAIQLALRGQTTCVLRRSRTVWCAGLSLNEIGGTSSGIVVPEMQPGLSDAIAIALGDRHACALGADKKMRCWGNDRYGQLGDTPTVLYELPQRVPGL